MTLDDEDDFWQFIAEQEELDEQSPNDWWENCLEGVDNPNRLRGALKTLADGGCTRADLLEGLREICWYGRYLDFDRKRGQQIVDTAMTLADLLKDVSLSGVPVSQTITPENLICFAREVKGALHKPQPAKALSAEVKKFLGDVDRRIRPNGPIGKQRTYHALALLLSPFIGRTTPAKVRGIVIRQRRRPEKQKPKTSRKRPRGRPIGSVKRITAAIRLGHRRFKSPD